MDASEDEIVWASQRGGTRAPKVPSGWCAWLGATGITRAIRWQDLRHTCAASLISGWWGRVWSLEEVREMLGHSSITVTARYVRFSKNMLAKAALETQIAQRRKYAHEG
jgi:integrase